MSKVKLIKINLRVAKEITRLLGKYEKQFCLGCSGEYHDENCPAREAFQLHNYLTQRINNPNRDYGI